MTRPIFFLTDFGLVDTYVGAVKAVILGIAPDARIADLTHAVPPQDVRAGAFALLAAAAFLPDDAVVLAVVDPGVGTSRRPIVVQAANRIFVGPDNGLLSWAIREDLTPPASLSTPVGAQGLRPPAGEVSAFVLDRPRFWRPTLSVTFHGRDLFGPIAAHLARGVPLTDVGSPCDDIQTLPFPGVRRSVDASGRTVTHAEVVHVDHYGNLISNLAATDLPPEPVFEIAGQTIVGLAPHFQAGPAGSLIALIGSAGLLEVAVPNGSAAALLGVGVGTAVSVAGRP
jgi:S-adenosyl-L-methionine hydrolase (adenosine-forming)